MTDWGPQTVADPSNDKIVLAYSDLTAGQILLARGGDGTSESRWMLRITFTTSHMTTGVVEEQTFAFALNGAMKLASDIAATLTEVYENGGGD